MMNEVKNIYAEGYYKDGDDCEEKGEPLLKNSEGTAISRSNKLIRACDWTAAALLIVSLIQYASLVMSSKYVLDLTIPRENMMLLGSGMITGFVAALYGTVSSLYQIIHKALHEQNISTMDKLMLYATAVMSPLNFIFLLLTTSYLSIYEDLIFLDLLNINFVVLLLGLSNLYMNIKRSQQIKPMALIQTLTPLYWGLLWLAAVLYKVSQYKLHH